MKNKGYVHIYYGESWAQVPTALGMAVRACGAGLRVGFFCRLDSFDDIGKLRLRLDDVHFGEIGDCGGIGFAGFDMIILHGCCGINSVRLIEMIRNKPEECELVLVGEGFGADVMSKADLISHIADIAVPI